MKRKPQRSMDVCRSCPFFSSTHPVEFGLLWCSVSEDKNTGAGMEGSRYLEEYVLGYPNRRCPRLMEHIVLLQDLTAHETT